jgi:hypothetical protein
MNFKDYNKSLVYYFVVTFLYYSSQRNITCYYNRKRKSEGKNYPNIR